MRHRSPCTYQSYTTYIRIFREEEKTHAAVATVRQPKEKDEIEGLDER